MGTCNFVNQENFDLIVYSDEDFEIEFNDNFGWFEKDF